MRVALFTNNYLPFRGGVTTAVETLRRGLERLRHRAWVFAPASRPAVTDPPWVFRYPSIPAPTYPGFALALPFSRRLHGTARALAPDIVHAQHPFLLGPAARRFARGHGRPLVFTYHTRYEKYAHYVPLPERLVAALAVRLSCRFAGSTDLVVAPSERIAATLRERGDHLVAGHPIEEPELGLVVERHLELGAGTLGHESRGRADGGPPRSLPSRRPR